MLREIDELLNDDVPGIDTFIDVMNRDALGGIFQKAPSVGIGSPIPRQKGYVQVDRSGWKSIEDVFL